MARNHAFVDGNKRTAIVTAATFLLLNGYELTANDGTLYEFTMGVAAGATSCHVFLKIRQRRIEIGRN